MANNALKSFKYDYDQNKIVDLLNKNFQVIEWALGGKLNGQNLDTKYLEDFVAEHATITELSASKIIAGAIGLDKDITVESNIITIDKNGLVITREDGAAEADFTAGTIGLFALVGDTMVPKLWFNAIEGTYVFDGMLSADVIEALSALIAPNLYAEKATIAEITVDELDTSDKVDLYNNESLADDNYIRIQGRTVEFITASTDGAHVEQARNRSNELLYWTDATKKAAATEVTDWPVITYVYNDLTKMKLSFELDVDTQTYIPMMIFGAGDGTDSLNAKGRIYKIDGGLCIEYKTYAGLERSIKLLESGVYITPFELEAINFYANGFSAQYSGRTFAYTWTKDGNGRITSLTTEDNLTIPVTWNGGNM